MVCWSALLLFHMTTKIPGLVDWSVTSPREQLTFRMLPSKHMTWASPASLHAHFDRRVMLRGRG